MLKLFTRFWIYVALIAIVGTAGSYWFNFLVGHIENSTLGITVFFIPFVMFTLVYGVWYDYNDSKRQDMKELTKLASVIDAVFIAYCLHKIFNIQVDNPELYWVLIAWAARDLIRR